MASPPTKTSVTFLGCGKLGSAILDGLLLASKSPDPSPSSSSSSSSSSSPQLQITSLTACVHRQSSYEALQQKYSPHSPFVSVLVNDNVTGAQKGDIIILGCKPYAYQDLLGEPGLREALAEKVMINIMVGLSAAQISETLYGTGPFNAEEEEQQCAIVNAIPNTAAAVRQSLTFICHPLSPPTASTALSTALSLLHLLGPHPPIPIPPSQTHLIPIYATIGASASAFYATVIEGIVHESEAQGVSHADAVAVAAAVLRGTADMMDVGHSLSAIRERIATPGGTTEKGLRVLEEKGVKGVMGEAVRVSMEAAREGMSK